MQSNWVGFEYDAKNEVAYYYDDKDKLIGSKSMPIGVTKDYEALKASYNTALLRWIKAECK